MVQRKGPGMPTTTVAGSRKSRSTVEKNSCPRRDQDRSEHEGVAELRKKLKKARTMRRISELEDLGSHFGHRYMQQQRKIGARRKLSSMVGTSEGSRPNYMKPTTCSDARKELLQVSFHGPAAGGKKGSPGGGGSVQNRSRLCSSSTASSSSSPPSTCNSKATTNKGAKALLTRKSSLKLVRPLMKKILGPPLFPKINASRATCSSTIKDSRFPKELELGPGATESEGTSAMRVCPYTYCSLNGHRHEPLPPLRTFVSSRRRLLKTQKSVKLKSTPSFRRRGAAKCDKRIAIPPLTDQVGDDFLVEIYAKLSENTTELVFDQSNLGTCPTNVDIEDDVGPENFSAMSSICGFGDSANMKSSDGDGDESSLELGSEEKPEQQGGNLGSVLEFLAIKCTESEDQEEDEDAEPQNEIRGLAENEALDLLQEPVVIDDDGVVLGYIDDGLAEEDVLPSIEKQALEALEDNGSLKNSSHFGSDASECEDAYSDDTDEKERLECIRVIVSEEQAQDAAIEDDNIAQDGQVGNDGHQNESEGADHSQGDDANAAIGFFRCDEIPELHSPEVVGLTEMNVECGNGSLINNDSRNLCSEEDSFEEEAANVSNLEQGRSQGLDGKKEDDVGVGGGGLADENSEIKQLEDDQSTKTEKEVECHVLHAGTETNDQNHEPEGTVGKSEIPVSDYCLIEANPNTAQGNDDCGAKEEVINNEATASDEIAMEALCDYGGCGDDAVTRNENSDDLAVTTWAREMLTASDHSLVEPNPNAQVLPASDHRLVEADPNAEMIPASDHSVDETNLNAALGNDAEAELKREGPSWVDHLDDGDLDGDKDKCEVDQDSATGRSKSSGEWDDGLMICGGTQQKDDGMVDPGEHDEFRFVGSDWAAEAMADTDLASKLKSRYNYTRKVLDDDHEELKPFNPRAPNFLPVEPDPEAERVDLKHQMVDDRKNAEEWMVDYALQRVVSRLAPAHERKVELLVEAFETVDDHDSPVLAPPRPIQACS